MAISLYKSSLEEKKYDLDDIQIIPSPQTNIESRKNIKTKYKEENSSSYHYPLFVAPMDTVISHSNYQTFLQNEIPVCLPRNEIIGEDQLQTNGVIYQYFNALSLKDFKYHYLSPVNRNNEDYYQYPSLFQKVVIDPVNYNNENYYQCPSLYKKVLIDIANGHMNDLYEAVKKAKEIHGDEITIMCGNVASPTTYSQLSDAGADYIRVSIGTGNACLTSQQTSVGYPLGSLISECFEIKKKKENASYIVVDGGMKSFADIIKSLALGADYVMLGSLFNKCIQSAGNNYWKGIRIKQSWANWMFKNGFKIKKKFRGMSTKEVQKKWNKSRLRTSEGIITKQQVDNTIEGFIENFDHYLQSAMSYTNCNNLEEFKGNVKVCKITHNAKKRFQK